MKWIKNGMSHHLQFETTGRHFYANGYVGIADNQDESRPAIAEGYDGHISLINTDGSEDILDYDKEDANEMTDEERTELADYMIGLWTKFKG